MYVHLPRPSAENMQHAALHHEVSRMHSSLFSEYQFVTQLATGAASNLALAESAHNPADQIIFKIFDSVRYDQPQEQERFRQEVHTLKQLHHPYILSLLDGEIRKGHPILISKYMPHGSLRNRLASVAPERILLGEALQIIVQIGQAL